MNKTAAIFRHEFRRTVRSKGFIIITLAIPLLALIGVGIIHITSGITPPSTTTASIGYVDDVGGFTQATTQPGYSFVLYADQDAATQALIATQVQEYFVIPADYLTTGLIQRYAMQQDASPSTATVTAITTFLQTNLLAGKVPSDITTRVENPLNLVTTTLTAEGTIAPPQNSLTGFIVPFAFSMLLAISLVFSSTLMLQSLAEEKENRLMEILLSSVSARQLISGKVLGRGLAALIQVVVWAVSLPLVLSLASSSVGGVYSSLSAPASFWVLAVVFFILSYTLFAVVNIGVAAISSTVQEAQSLAGFYGILAIAPIWFVSLLVLYPNNPVWVVLSCLPFMGPTLVLLRLGLTSVPLWQLAVSMGVQALFILGGLRLAAKLLRLYLLMYGKRPNLGEVLHNLRQG